MIMSMKKYAFLVFHRDYQDFLLKLGKLGILHVIEEDSGEAEETLRRGRTRALDTPHPPMPGRAQNEAMVRPSSAPCLASRSNSADSSLGFPSLPSEEIQRAADGPSPGADEEGRIRKSSL